MIDRRPSDNDFNEYYKKYIDLVEENDVIGHLKYALSRNIQFFNEIATEKWDYSYMEGKWSVKQVLQHLIDTERVMAYRAMRVARNDKTELPGFDQDEFAENAELTERSVKDLIDEYFAVRKASVTMFSSFTNDVWNRRGTASNSPVTPLSLAFIIAGHELHHIDVIKKMYL